MGLFEILSLLDTRSTLIGTLVFVVLFWFLRRPRNLPPGPTGWPVLGYLPQIALAGEDPHVVFSNLVPRYGSVISLNLAGNLVVVLHGYSTIKEAFNQQQLSARPRTYTSERIHSGKGVITSSGETWMELRRFCLTVLRGLGVGKASFEENIAIEAECLITEWKKHEEAPFDPKHLISNAVANVICSVVIGKRFQYTDTVFKRFLKCTDDIAQESGAGGALEFSAFISRLTFLPFVRKYINSIKNYCSQIRFMVEEHNRDFDAENIRDLIDTFMKQKELKERIDGESGVFSFDNLLIVLGDLFFAGSETTTTTLRWMMLYMMANPDVQTRVQKELDNVTNRNRFPRISDKSDLPYTEAVMSEIQRMSTIAPLAVPHFCSEDTTLLGYNIPKGTIIVSNLWHSHFDPTVWEEPHSFCPERFLDKDGKLINRENFTPFGIGRRICLGEHLAKMELFIFFTLLLHQFTFKNPRDAPPVSFQGLNSGTWAPLNFKVCAIVRN